MGFPLPLPQQNLSSISGQYLRGTYFNCATLHGEPQFFRWIITKIFPYLGKYVKSLFTDISVMVGFVIASVSHAAFSDSTKWLCVHHWCVHVCSQFSTGVFLSQSHVVTKVNNFCRKYLINFHQVPTWHPTIISTGDYRLYFQPNTVFCSQRIKSSSRHWLSHISSQ